MGDDSSLDEWLRAEARVLNLDRTPWHMTWVGVRPHDEVRMYVHTYICSKVKNSQRLGLDTNAVWVDARQMMTTRTSDTQTQTSSQDTQPAGCHTP